MKYFAPQGVDEALDYLAKYGKKATVLLDGEPVRSCLTIAMTVNGKKVSTIEAFTSREGKLHPLQEAFHEHGATQCGFCTPGVHIHLGKESEAET